MLHSIVGLMNSGKTLYATYNLFLDYLKGRTILTNFNVAFPHKHIDLKFILKLATEQVILENVSIGYDEIWLDMDSRSSAKTESKLGSYMFLQSSKDDMNIYYTAQNNNQSDIRLRQNLHKLSSCRRVLIQNDKIFEIPPLFKDKRILPKDIQELLYIEVTEHKRVTIGVDTMLIPHKKIYIYAKNIFMLYNTKQKMYAHLSEKELSKTQ